MTAVMTPETETEWTTEAIEAVVLKLLGRHLDEDPDDLKKRLLEQNTKMPIDSLDLFDLLQEFRDVTGLTVPVRKLGRRTMRSIRSFSDFVAKEAQA